MAKNKVERPKGYELKLYWEDGCTVEFRYFHKKENAIANGEESGYEYAVVPLLPHEHVRSNAWWD